MNKVAIVFWSGTGNTEQMANSIAQGVRGAGGAADLFGPSEFSASKLDAYDVFAFGCPSMGGEQLEEDEFEPMFSAIKGSLGGKKLALFGSYGWGDGQWMRDWCDDCRSVSAKLFEADGLIINDTPDDLGKASCSELGRSLAAW